MSEAQRGPGKFSQAAALKSHFFPVCTAVTPCVFNQFDFYLPLFQTKKVRKQTKKKKKKKNHAGFQKLQPKINLNHEIFGLSVVCFQPLVFVGSCLLKKK